MKRFVILLLTLTALLLSPVVFAQEGCEPTGDGAVQPSKSAVKKIGDGFTVRWVAPTQMADAGCTPLASDPEFALTSYEIYIEVGQPARSGAAFPPVATVGASQTMLNGTLNFNTLTPGSDVYFAVAACNQFGCSDLSEQAWVKVGGPPGKAQSVGVQ